MKLNRNNLADNSSPIPRAEYTVLIADVKTDPSRNSGAEMIALVCEILKPQTVEAEGRPVITAGRQFTTYLAFSEKAAARSLKTLEKLFGEAIPDEVDTEDLKIKAVKDLKNKIFRAALRPSPRYETVDGKPGGTPIVGADGQPIISSYGIEVVSFNSAATEIGAPDQAF